MQNRFTRGKEKYKLLVNLKVQSFLFCFAVDFVCCPKLKKKVTHYCSQNGQGSAWLVVMYETMQGHCAICL